MPESVSRSPASFHRGYFSGDGYIYKAYPEYFPQRLSLVALLAGQRPPRLDQPFRLVEFGCGQGVSLCLQAALHPTASFCGIDLLASHISHGRQLAAAAGLTNVSFQDADLIALAAHASCAPGSTTLAQAAPAAGSVDMVTCHGMLSWVSREVQQSIWQLASSCLRPGGLLALSYNAFPGNLSSIPFQHLVRALQDSHGAGSSSLQAAIELSQRLQQCNAGVFRAQPNLRSLLEDLPSKDPAYLPHEYNQQHWQPRFSDAVIDLAASHGFSFLASAVLTDSFEGLLPPAFRDLLAEQHDPARRQLLRDLLVNAAFRRDVYARGHDRLWPLDSQEALREIRIQRLIDADQLETSDPQELFRFHLSFCSLQGNPDWFGSFLRAMGSEPRCLGDLAAPDGGEAIPLPELLQNLALLLEKGLVAELAPPVDPTPSQTLNRVITAKLRAGAPYRHLAAPLIGSCITIGDLDGLALAAHLDGHDAMGLVKQVDAALRDLDREVEQDGRTLEGDDRDAFLRRSTDRFLRRTLPRLRRLGAVA